MKLEHHDLCDRYRRIEAARKALRDLEPFMPELGDDEASGLVPDAELALGRLERVVSEAIDEAEAVLSTE